MKREEQHKTPWWQSIADALLFRSEGEKKVHGAEMLFRLRSLTVVLLAILLLTIVWVGIYIGHREIQLASITALGSVLTLGLLAFLRKKKDVELAATGLIATAYLIVLNVCLSADEVFYYPGAGWLYAIPVLAAAFTTKQTKFWTFLVAITLTLIWAMPADFIGREWSPKSWQYNSLFARISEVFFIFAALGIWAHRRVLNQKELQLASGQLRRQEEELRKLALFDSLTTLPSRPYLDTLLSRLSEQTSPFALLFLDLDRFKSVNDSLGHPAGDALLLEVSERLETQLGDVNPSEAMIGDNDSLMHHRYITRWGGDEFVLVVPGSTQAEAEQLARQIERSLYRPFNIAGKTIYASASIGISLFPNCGRNPAELLQAADVALYAAKNDANTTFRFYRSEMAKSSRRKLLLENALREALQKEELSLAYQPVYSTKSGRASGVECLLRWQSDSLNEDISPLELIPIAETTGLIHSIGAWTLAQACKTATTWEDSIRLAVNVSSIQLQAPDFIMVVDRALKTSGLDPKRLELEITESVLLDNNVQTKKTIDHIRALGVQLAIDDFGTGYSNLQYLHELPTDRLKIDSSFVVGMNGAPEKQGLVRSIVAFGKSLGLKTIAEGVESADHAQELREMGCLELQGFHLARPMPAEKLAPYLRNTISILSDPEQAQLPPKTFRSEH